MANNRDIMDPFMGDMLKWALLGGILHIRQGAFGAGGWIVRSTGARPLYIYIHSTTRIHLFYDDIQAGATLEGPYPPYIGIYSTI